MMSCRRRLSFLYLLPFLLLLLFFFPRTTASDDGPAPVNWVCGSDNYTSGSAYESNLSILLASLNASTNASLSGFKSDSVGQDPDIVEGLVLCRGDVNATECASCLRYATREILTYCPYNKNATIWYEACYVHYSNVRFLSSANNEPYVLMHNAADESDIYGLVKLFRDAIMNSISYQAAYINTANKFATAEVNFTKMFSRMFGMTQCTPDLSDDECSACLQSLNDMMPRWVEGKQGGKALGIRCAMRLESYSFFYGRPMLMLASSDELNLTAPSSSAPPGSSPAGAGTTHSKSFYFVIIGVGICALCLLIGVVLWSYWFWKRRTLIKLKTKFFKQNGGLLLQQQLSSQGIDAATKTFTIEELRKSTSNFDDAKILGRGGHGTVYKGVLKDQRVVAIKKSIQLHEKQSRQFINEIVILSEISHRNVVKLLGCCLDAEVPLLVYEFVTNGSLFRHIHGGDSLPWEDRLRIATEIAGALAYLHGAASMPIIHRDVKSTNILLDEHFTAKISDFGISKSMAVDHTHLTTLVQGTHGYLDPEYCHTCQLTEKSDVYSFGVVLAELLTGELPVSFDRPEGQTNLASHFVRLFDEGRLTQMIGPKITEEAEEDELLMVAYITRSCLNLKGEERPPMKEVAMQLEGLRAKSSRKYSSDQQSVGELGFSRDDNGVSSSKVAMTSTGDSLVNEMLASFDLPR